MLFVSTLSSALLSGSIVFAPPSKSSYPDTRRVDHFDEYHGERVPDPYRWLEDDARDSEDVQAWIDAQNKVTFSYLKSIPERPQIESRLTELWNRKAGPQRVRAGRYSQALVCVGPAGRVVCPHPHGRGKVRHHETRRNGRDVSCNIR